MRKFCPGGEQIGAGQELDEKDQLSQGSGWSLGVPFDVRTPAVSGHAQGAKSLGWGRGWQKLWRICNNF